MLKYLIRFLINNIQYKKLHTILTNSNISVIVWEDFDFSNTSIIGKIK